jgi:HD-GYP domain-containing protein (c-di-GMP phosphodiesterase class II)
LAQQAQTVQYDPKTSVSRLYGRMESDGHRIIVSDMYDPLIRDARILQQLARLEKTDREHSERVSRICIITGINVGSTTTGTRGMPKIYFSSDDIEQLAVAGLFHELGQVGLLEYAKAQRILDSYFGRRDECELHMAAMPRILAVADCYDKLMLESGGNAEFSVKKLLRRFGPVSRPFINALK